MFDMKDITIIYGTETNMTKLTVMDLISHLPDSNVTVVPINELSPFKFEGNDLYILSAPTWYSGGLSGDWENLLEEFKKLPFKNKNFAIFGLGDALGYPEYFVDGIGVLAQIVLERGGRLIGRWDSREYDFDHSQASIDGNTFYGLAIDEDNEPEKTKQRFQSWVNQILKELKEF